MTTVHKWRIHCITEPADHYLWDTETPTVCPIDAGHTILPAAIVQTVEQTAVTLVEENIPTDGSFFIEGFGFSNAANTTTDNNISFPYPINVMAIEMTPVTGEEDDTVQIVVGENTIVGVLTVASNSSDITFSTTAETIAYIHMAFLINLDDGTNNDILGRVVGVDRVLNTFTMETAATNAFSAGTYIKMTKRVLNTPVGPSSTHSWGESKIGGSYVPANAIITVKYTNNHATDVHKIYGYIQYLA